MKKFTLVVFCISLLIVFSYSKPTSEIDDAIDYINMVKKSYDARSRVLSGFMNLIKRSSVDFSGGLGDAFNFQANKGLTKSSIPSFG